jgi:hypothetical protein
VTAANRIPSDDNLSITFIQIGNDAGATTFLNFLDNNLGSQGARFGIFFALFTCFRLVFAWFSLGFRLVFAWFSLGFRLVFAWFSLGLRDLCGMHFDQKKKIL